MSSQMQKDAKPQREQWFVFLYPASFGLSLINGLSVIALATLKVTDQNVTLKEFLDFFKGSQFTPQQVSKIAPSKILYFGMILSLLLLLIIFLPLFIVLGNPLSTIELVILILVVIIIIVSPTIFLKVFKIQYKTHTDPRHIYFIYFCCLRHQSSSIVDALIRCGFVDKLEPKPVASNQPLV